MKVENLSSSLLQIGLIFVLVSLSLYSFSESFLYDPVSGTVGSILPSFFPEPIYLALVFLFILGILISLGETSTTSGSSTSRKFTGFLILISIPSLWGFSNHNWLELAGVYLDTSLGFYRGLLIAGVLVFGHFLIDYIGSIQEWISRLGEGGALESELRDLYFKKSLFSVFVVFLAFFISSVIIVGSMLVESSLSNIIMYLPQENFVVGIGVPIILFICIVYIIRSHFR